MYTTPDLVEQRRQVLHAITPQSGEYILDVGSGPGFLTRIIGESVGTSGRVCGIDISEPLLMVANAQCAHMPWVEFRTADAARIPFANDHFHALVSTQVLEYVTDVDAALIEFHRVLRPGGRVIIMDTDWDSIVWHTNNRARMNHILAVWDGHCADPHLPTTLAKRINQSGLQVKTQQIIPMLNSSLTPDTFSNRLIDLIVSFVSGREGITNDEAMSWAQELRTLGEMQDYFFSLNRYLFLACKTE